MVLERDPRTGRFFSKTSWMEIVRAVSNLLLAVAVIILASSDYQLRFIKGHYNKPCEVIVVPVCTHGHPVSGCCAACANERYRWMREHGERYLTLP